MSLIDAVNILHSRQLFFLHGDLKLDNVLVDMGRSPPLARISDFGLMAPMSQSVPDTWMEYLQEDHRMPPEFSVLMDPATGTWGPNHSRAARFSLDIWMLGCMLWQLITGQIIEGTSGSDFYFVSQAHLNPSPLATSLTAVPHVPLELKKLIMEMLDVNETQRPNAAAAHQRAKQISIPSNTITTTPPLSGGGLAVPGFP